MNVVLFDIDHTLMASPPGANARASQRMFKDLYGVDASEDAVEKVGMTEWGVIERVLEQVGVNPIPEDDAQHRIPDKVYQYWAEVLKTEIADQPSTLEPGIWDLLNRLADETEVKLGLLTGNSYWRSEVKLEAVGIDEFFRDHGGNLIGAFGNEARTREGLLAFARDRLVFDNDCLSIVDDSLIGAQMLAESGVYGIFVGTGSASVDELKQYQQVVFEDFGENRWQEVLQYIQVCTKKSSA